MRSQTGLYPGFGKRLLDISVSAVLLVLLFPFLALIAIAVRWKMGPPVLFIQRRPGRGGKPIALMKFRTMRQELSGDGEILSDAERLTDFGRWLRSTSVDELPELVNVLRGDMSLVGPRPLLMEYLSRYSPTQARRHAVRPGITGWAQVNGRNELPWHAKFELDVWYVDHLSAALDAQILLRTVRAVVSRRGVSAKGEATVSPFEG